MRLCVVSSALALLVGLLAPPSVEAQGDPARDAVEAFEEGTLAAEEERWSDAIPAFRRAYVLTHSSLALFNTGYALRALGRFVEARAAFDEVIAAGAEPDLLAEARTYREEIATRIASLRLEGLDEGLRYDVRLDATTVPDGGARPLVLEADPGAHSLQVRLSGFLPFDWAGELGQGATRPLSVTLSPVPSGSTVLDEPWFWIVVGVVIAGGAVTAGLVADDGAQLRAGTDRTEVRL